MGDQDLDPGSLGPEPMYIYIYIYFFFFFWMVPHGLQDLSSPTRD